MGLWGLRRVELPNGPLEEPSGAPDRQDGRTDSGEKQWRVPGRMGFPRAASVEGEKQGGAVQRSQSRACNDCWPGRNHVSWPGTMSCAQLPARTQEQ